MVAVLFLPPLRATHSHAASQLTNTGLAQCCSDGTLMLQCDSSEVAALAHRTVVFLLETIISFTEKCAGNLYEHDNYDTEGHEQRA